MSTWFVYIVECVDGTFYTGITTDLARRMKEHNSGGRLAAKYTRKRGPVKLAYQQSVTNRSTASRREWTIKQMSKQQKQQLIDQ